MPDFVSRFLGGLPPRRGYGARLALDLLAVLGAATGYYLCAAIGTVLSVPPSGFAIIWPATAFIISLLLILPPRRWWLCIAGVVPTHFYIAATLQSHAPYLVVITQIAGNVALALTTVLALRATSGDRVRLDSVNSVVRFILLAGIAVPAVVDAVVVSVHLTTGWTRDFWLAWQQWMVGSIFPTITIPPVFLLASQGALTGNKTGNRGPLLELALLASLLFAVTFIIFDGQFDTTQWPALLFAPLPFLLAAAARLGVGGTSVTLLTLASAIVIQALRHNGPFAIQAPIDDVVSLQAYLITTAIPLILLAALMDERRRTMNLLRQSEARMQLAASSTDTGLWQWDRGSGQLWLTDHCRAMFGVPRGQHSSPLVFLGAVYPDDRPRMEEAIMTAMASPGDRSAQDYRVARDGQIRWLLLSMHSEADEAGMIQLSGVFRDVTERVETERERDELRRRVVRFQDDERRRIAEELHESTAQHLVAAKLHLSVLESGAEAVSTGELLAQAMKSVDEASTEIRTMSYLIHAPRLDSFALSRVLQQYLSGVGSRSGIGTSLRADALVDLLPVEPQRAVLRIAQESIGNVHRHARATHVAVSVRCVRRKLHVIVSDNGKGIAPNEGQGISERFKLAVGIKGTTARVRNLHRGFDGNGHTRGTRVHVAIPIAVPE